MLDLATALYIMKHYKLLILSVISVLSSLGVIHKGCPQRSGGRFGQMLTPTDRERGKEHCGCLQASTSVLFQYVWWMLSMVDA